MTINGLKLILLLSYCKKNINENDKVKPPRKDLILRELEKHNNGTCSIDSAKCVSVSSVVRYICSHSDQLIFCKRVLSQIIAVSTNQKNVNFSSNKEIYSAIAKTNFHSPNLEHYLLVRVNIKDSATFMTQYKEDFTQLEWQ